MKIKNFKLDIENKFNIKNKRFILTSVFIAVVILASVFILGINNPYNKSKEDSVTELKKSQEDLSKIADQEIISIKKRLTNDQLSELSASEILEKYNDNAKAEFTSLFEGADKSRDYALTLIGKVIPTTTLKTIDGQSVILNKKTMIVILNTGDKSKSFVEQMNKIEVQEGITYLAIFPSETTENVKKFIEETKLDTTKFKVASLSDNPKTSGQPDLLGIAEYYFNAKGVPSYVSFVSNSITFAGSGNTEKVFESFKKKAFTEPYLYNEIK